jgi:hypothetical protein
MKHYFFIFLAILFANAGFSQGKQSVSDVSESPKFVVKTNALYWFTTTPNLSLETTLSAKLTLDISANFNPWKFSKEARFQHFLIQPELRYWFDNPMQGHFVGIHAHYLRVNVGLIDGTLTNFPFNMRLSFLPDFRKKGNIFGIGAAYGYSWKLGTKWYLEGVASLGYAHLNYLVFRKNGEQMGGTHYYNYVGPTKLAVNLVYVIK